MRCLQSGRGLVAADRQQRIHKRENAYTEQSQYRPSWKSAETADHFTWPYRNSRGPAFSTPDNFGPSCPVLHFQRPNQEPPRESRTFFTGWIIWRICYRGEGNRISYHLLTTHMSRAAAGRHYILFYVATYGWEQHFNIVSTDSAYTYIPVDRPTISRVNTFAIQ